MIEELNRTDGQRAADMSRKVFHFLATHVRPENYSLARRDLLEIIEDTSKAGMIISAEVACQELIVRQQ